MAVRVEVCKPIALMGKDRDANRSNYSIDSELQDLARFFSSMSRESFDSAESLCRVLQDKRVSFDIPVISSIPPEVWDAFDDHESLAGQQYFLLQILSGIEGRYGLHLADVAVSYENRREVASMLNRTR